MSTVQIYRADMAFLNEIPFRCVQDAEQYADQLKKTDPTHTYLVVDDSGRLDADRHRKRRQAHG